MKVSFELTGTTPLLMHQDNVEAADALAAWRQAPENKDQSKPGDDRSPPWTWQTYLYTDGEKIVWPAENLMVCLRQAGTQMTLKGQKTYKEITQSGLLIEDEFADFMFDGKQLGVDRVEKMKDAPFAEQVKRAQELGFRLFVKRAAIKSSGKVTKHVRVRPRFDSWSVRGTISIINPTVTYEKLVQLFDIAGRVGLGDWRPGCKTPGPFGMFEAKLKKA